MVVVSIEDESYSVVMMRAEEKARTSYARDAQRHTV